MNNRKISFSLSLSLSTYRYSNEKKNSRKREGDPCLKRSTERKHVNWFTGAYRVRVFRRFCPELGHCLGYTHSWNSRGRRSGYERNALLFFAPPSLCNWIRAVEKNRIHSTNSSWTTFRLRSTVETISRCFSKQTNKRLVVD